jgi:hypothetical protein
MGKYWQGNRTRQLLAIAAIVAFAAQLTLALQVLPQGLASEFGDIKEAKKAYALLENLAKDAVSLDDNLGRKRVSISNRIVAYDFRPASAATLTSRPDRLTGPLEVLIRAEALGRDFRVCASTQVFWVRPLEQVRSITAKVVDAAYKTGSEDEWNSEKQTYETQVGAEFTVLEKELLAYADKEGLGVRTSRGPVQGYQVEIRIDPPRAHVKFMPFLNYKRCVAFNLNLKDYWVDLNAGTQTLIGKYHYLAEWPPSLNGPDEGNFDIYGDGVTLTFQPKAN